MSSKHLENNAPAMIRLQSLLGAALLAAGGLVSLPAHANTDPLSDLLGAPGSAGLGFAVRAEQSPYVGGGTRYDLLPLYLYEGKRVFLHGSRAGLKLFDEETQRVDLFLDQRFEGYADDRLPPSLAGMAERGSGLDAGVSYRYRQPWGTLQAEYLQDVSRFSKGSELRLSYSYDWRSGRLALRPSLTVSVRNARLNNYYYGVRPDEATATRPAYEPGSGINTTLGLYGTYELSEGWRLLGGITRTVLDGKVKASPIVGRSAQTAVFLGAAYDFGTHKQHWAEESSPTHVKVLYGKSTEDGCHLAKIITLTCASTAKVNSTRIAGVQIGKPFIEQLNGWPLDIVGYVGLLQHDDRGLASNGLQLDAFMKAYYYGFPWSDRVKTRLGLGLGVSLAQRVPYSESSSQAARGRQTSRLLNYLDPSIDVSLGDLVGSRALKNTYLGFGVSHRSGIFGASRLLGNVDGGSNYIYTYLETVL
ncbi:MULTISPECIES: MipA/OmpV family protein [unclassified Polaromonas]|jgi:outer membrane protein|uniref:MipA/OmpV family protein n=1 Tax=unclassified Polaromonas TaxID=2638319 RepID=UPI000BDAC164|nr:MULTISPECIES: MipA/OmpV family protein [unclassified Polaromonas]OYZ20868.1 MAG: structural protein MipA [Polaromonas sp. 16-63-31]OYZ78464.1 MAG: structural protein MipA [Polaromonas sp. 24-63-21]OZA49102.1 MAG: structural protein MipA [Polaromonas sp. 17-63-33]OZA88920.1 MAG: structural protein MipA [Polaromonas sp. 39-63-25]HQR97299.1 MipA/OmpV family protein [Polaromonas sp.]